MTRRENLQEQYEDALFALLMDDFAVSEGKSALEENNRLKQDANFDIPADVRRRCLKTISKSCSRASLHQAGKILCRSFSKIAMFTMICMLFFTTAFAVSPTIRATTLNFIITTFDDRTELEFETPISTQESQQPYNISVGWLPNGYSLVNQSISRFRISNAYQAADGKRININIFLGSNNVLGVDTEAAQTENIIIQGQPGILVEKNNTTQIVWIDTDEKCKITIDISDVGEDINQTLLNISEHLLIEKN